MTAALMEEDTVDRVPLPEVQAREALLKLGVPESALEEIDGSDHCSFWGVLEELRNLRDQGRYTWSSIIHFQFGDAPGRRSRGIRPIDYQIHGRML